MKLDVAGEKYWSTQWQHMQLPRPIQLSGIRPSVGFYRQFHRIWRRYLPFDPGKGKNFLEIGCARSVWLPYFSKEGYNVSGLDYSSAGCQQARAVLQREGAAGQIYHQDLFFPEDNQREQFDVVFSNGVVEHFLETETIIKAISQYLRPGGKIITIIPNYTGWLGKLKGFINQESLNIHVLLNRQDLEKHHQACSFRKLYCDYRIFIDPNCLHAKANWPKLVKIVFKKIIFIANIIVGWVWLALPNFTPKKRTGSYIIYIGEKVILKSPEIKNRA
jgi:2-polyprenyl-3-methyl-5-hydroxy-6-metoxy-1,4-benzoquinol methylase